MNLKGKNVFLRAIEKDDLEFLRNMMNDSELESKVVGWSFPISKFEQEKWYENQLSNRNNIRLIVEVENKKIGLATVHDIDWKNRKAGHRNKTF